MGGQFATRVVIVPGRAEVAGIAGAVENGNPIASQIEIVFSLSGEACSEQDSPRTSHMSVDLVDYRLING